MFHAVGIITIPTSIKDYVSYIEKILEPFDSSRLVEPYIDLTVDPKQELANAVKHYQSSGVEVPADELDVLTGWIGGMWKVDEYGEPRRWTTRNPNGKWNEWSTGKMFPGCNYKQPTTTTVLKMWEYIETEIMAVQSGAKLALTFPISYIDLEGGWHDRQSTMSDMDWLEEMSEYYVNQNSGITVTFVTFLRNSR